MNRCRHLPAVGNRHPCLRAILVLRKPSAAWRRSASAGRAPVRSSPAGTRPATAHAVPRSS
jgi:hypothetical protein